MTIQDIILFGLILIGAILGIAIGISLAFGRALKKIKREENPYQVRKRPLEFAKPSRKENFFSKRVNRSKNKTDPKYKKDAEPKNNDNIQELVANTVKEITEDSNA